MPTATLERDTSDPLSLAFAALADPTRRDLVARLSASDATLSELAAPYAMSLQAVAKHLAVLEKAGLVSRGREAQRRPVHLEAEALSPVADWLERYRQAAEERFARLDDLLATLPPGPDSPPAGPPHGTPHDDQPTDQEDR